MITRSPRFRPMVTIDYICHSCVLVTTADTSIVFDPWFHGASYYGQWVVFSETGR
jgi:L-ascorbate metabolism protein UlaG (beta-lactamase superfamily)